MCVPVGGGSMRGYACVRACIMFVRTEEYALLARFAEALLECVRINVVLYAYPPAMPIPNPLVPNPTPTKERRKKEEVERRF